MNSNPHAWRIKSPHPDAPPGFPFAIVGEKKEVVAWVKTKTRPSLLSAPLRGFPDWVAILHATNVCGWDNSSATANSQIWLSRKKETNLIADVYPLNLRHKSE
jgi:hypothetical protein